MKWKKAPQQLIDTFNHIAPEGPGIEKRKMFGYPCRFVNRNLFMGLHQENMILRLSEQDRKAFLKLKQAHQFEPMPGRIMREYVLVPSWMLENTNQLNEWIKKSLTYVSSLPPKVKKMKKSSEK